jgi:hypothetical protein
VNHALNNGKQGKATKNYGRKKTTPGYTTKTTTGTGTTYEKDTSRPHENTWTQRTHRKFASELTTGN